MLTISATVFTSQHFLFSLRNICPSRFIGKSFFRWSLKLCLTVLNSLSVIFDVGHIQFKLTSVFYCFFFARALSANDTASLARSITATWFSWFTLNFDNTYRSWTESFWPVTLLTRVLSKSTFWQTELSERPK